MKNFLLIVISVMLGATGQLLTKKGMMDFGSVGAVKVWSQVLRIFLVPYVFLGFVCFVVSSILWLSVISKNEISYAYPMVSMSYVVILFVSSVWFHEVITPLRLLGVLLICAGVFAITRTY